MEQTFQLEFKDYLNFTLFVYKRNPWAIFVWIVLALALPGPLMTGVVFGHGATPMRSILVEAILLLLSFSVIVFLLRRSIAYMVKQRPGSLGVFTTTITPEMLIEANPIIESRVRWEHISEITESADLLVFMLSPQAAYLIPKRAFRDTEHAREFLETARAYQNGMLRDIPETQPAWPPQPRRRRD